MKIAVVGWGSLVWDPIDLETEGGFAPNGPLLPIEFCRVSRGGWLRLVIDENYGAVCTTHSAPSALDDLEAAIANMSLRENLREASAVGFVDLVSGHRSEAAMRRHPEALATIASWAEANGYDAAVWSALPSNFSEPDKGGEPFSVSAAMAYLEALQQRDANLFASALAYFRNAPREVETPVREEVAKRWPVGAA